MAEMIRRLMLDDLFIEGLNRSDSSFFGWARKNHICSVVKDLIVRDLAASDYLIIANSRDCFKMRNAPRFLDVSYNSDLAILLMFLKLLH